ncbi:MAG: CarD family transcriptional regulator [Lachnospiraceae bacterium]|jgi:CarD family transcriptional regulator|uniref:CarD family transcriptional regulator n=1 Tax=Candidatus Scatomorpha intestinigallinarum TaxID=2840923 RepID=A0A9D1DNG4_9FIRM|nr:CarD family transcriptional regulator [Candidatus Scatomorpha intestinigallinarum]
MTFRVGDRIAHPMHGAGVIDSVVKRKINGTERDYYVLKLPAGDMLVMIPVDTSAEIGVRPIVDADEAEKILGSIPGLEIEMTQNWNKRYRENMLKIKSGNLLEVAAVVKGLMQRDKERGLSTGERKMLHSAKQILISEIVLSESASYEEVEERLNSALVCS